MGGKKKLSLKQMQKAQKKKPDKNEKRTAITSEKSVPGVTIPNLKDEKLTNELKKMKVITPYAVASHFDLRMSTARAFLAELESKGKIKFVSKSRNLTIYKSTD